MGSEQQVATMDTVRDLSSALWSLRTSQEAARLLRTSLSLLRCFLFFDICYLIGGITLISMALSNQVKDQDNRMVFAGGLLTLFGSLSAMCNSLASHGLRTWRRAFLLPWLLFFLLVLAFLFLHLAQVFYQYHLRLKWERLFLFLATYCLFSCWRHIHKQYLVMAFPDRSRSSSTSSPLSEITCGRPLLTRLLEICHPSMRRCRQLQLRSRKRRHLHRSTTSMLNVWMESMRVRMAQ